WQAQEALESFERMIAGADPKLRAVILMRGTTEALRLVDRSSDPAAYQQVIDDLDAMAEEYGIDPAAVQNLMSAAAIDASPDAGPAEPPPVESEAEFGMGEPTATFQKRSPLKLTYFDNCGDYANKRHILKGIIALRETSAWIAPPGAGKSA